MTLFSQQPQKQRLDKNSISGENGVNLPTIKRIVSSFSRPDIMRFLILQTFFSLTYCIEKCKRVITRYLSFMEDLLYTISKVKLLEDILMPQPIVPVEIPQSRRFDSKKRIVFMLLLLLSTNVSLCMSRTLGNYSIC